MKKVNGNAQNKADIWTQSMPQAIKHGVSWCYEDVLVGVVACLGPKMASDNISKLLTVKKFSGVHTPDAFSCCVFVVMCLQSEVSFATFDRYE